MFSTVELKRTICRMKPACIDEQRFVNNDTAGQPYRRVYAVVGTLHRNALHNQLGRREDRRSGGKHRLGGALSPVSEADHRRLDAICLSLRRSVRADPPGRDRAERERKGCPVDRRRRPGHQIVITTCAAFECVPLRREIALHESDTLQPIAGRRECATKAT